METLREKAAALRDAGYSYNLISQRLGISKSTLSDWLKNRPFQPNREVLDRVQYGPIKSGALKHEKRMEETRQLRQKGIEEIGSLTERDLWLLGLGIYIGEGSKAYEMIQVANADPLVIKLTMRWFREVCHLPDENITIAIHLYPDNDVDECLKFWRDVTGLSPQSFRKVQVDTRVGKSVAKKRKLPFGTAHIKIVCGKDREKGVRLHRRIMGWIAGTLEDKSVNEAS